MEPCDPHWAQTRRKVAIGRSLRRPFLTTFRLTTSSRPPTPSGSVILPARNAQYYGERHSHCCAQLCEPPRPFKRRAPDRTILSHLRSSPPCSPKRPASRDHRSRFEATSETSGDQRQVLARLRAAGQAVATFAPSGTAIEIGWCELSAARPLGGVESCTEGHGTPAGADFRYLLEQLGANPGGMALRVRFFPTLGTTVYAGP